MASSDHIPPREPARQQAIDWLVRLRSDAVGDADIHAFADWLAQDEQHAEAFAAAEALFNDMAKAGRGLTVPAATGRAQHRHGHRRRAWVWSAAAAMAAWIVVSSLLAPPQFSVLDPLLSDFRTLPGEQRVVTLDDGSRLALDTNTAVAVEFDQHTRRLRLRHGQIHAQVAADTRRPFEVSAGPLIVAAKGTAFGVDIGATGEIRVTVDEHAVQVRSETPKAYDGEPVVVLTGQQLAYRPGQHLLNPRPVNLNDAMAWRRGKLVIDNRPLIELIDAVERYRVGRIFIADQALRQVRVSGVFALDDPEATLRTVRQVLALQESRVGPWWVILHR